MCKTVYNNVIFDKTIYIAVPMYNLMEYSDNYSDRSGSLWQVKRDEVHTNNVDLTIDNSQSFKYKTAIVGKTNQNDRNSFPKETKLVIPLKYLYIFCRLLEMLLINYKVHPELNWIEDCILYSAGNSTFYSSLSTKDIANLTKQLSKGFRRSVYWNNYQRKPVIVTEKGISIYELLNASFQGVKKY